MYINKTSRRIIFLNALLLAGVVLWITESFHKSSSLFNTVVSLYVFSFSVIFESLRLPVSKRKLKKMFKIFKNEIGLANKPERIEELQPEMEEMPGTDRM